jgi:hypothetical protein
VREIEYVGRQHTVECFPFVNVYNPTRKKTTFNSKHGNINIDGEDEKPKLGI